MTEHTINVIYVKGAVSYLLPFLDTLIEHSSCSFRLVSNACTNKEEQMLRDYCHNKASCSFLSLGYSQMALHHKVLNHLLQIDDNSPYFAFLDSDILTTGPFLDDWLNKLNKYDAVFTGLPVWQSEEKAKLPQDFKIMGGRYLQSESGAFLGISFGAAYRKESLADFIQSSGVSFERYHFEEVPKQYQGVLKKLNLDKYFYDTGKLLNILWQQQGAKMAYFNSGNLYHVGGVSALIHQNLPGARRWYNIIRSALPIYLRAWIKRKRTGKVVSFAESLDMEILLKDKRAIKALLLSEVFGVKISMIDKMYLNSLNQHLISETKKMAGFIKDLSPQL